ncbi:MAG: 2-hydroxyacyl-CoA dehydratase subunit D [Desulfomonilia bacterium]|jgi:benzoyl-CoA reductase subunit C|uniref:R-phenyllactate dehydratase beta subunit n=1 Tax=anaerobic digester metagenome TaxID=1263854 RepID=A0A485LWY8_9ZZZZ|nr:2-hydroxyacyl-CoA dehydratase family protein [Pseudomonadota bacterium]HON38042.1 2-hydroxyacyl-CoA dehydratase family protein [Deltaproteobacteria bacterium]HRS55255.1 2-hydroxyacyl-CoA dehydratase family protein [Desulfomonilia bacterium]HPD20421.1 2-hydroxyacyl-CoA dehydratase family protein [Deltaproteobacteria bacterium]HPW69414.1 2-hydroxyacyl-CoA dehydratase family protein [Deltaproteobacteria bacterium]
MDILNEFIEVAADPGAYARRIRASGRSVIGYYCSYAPEEIIHAAGLHPIRLFGTGGDSGIADRHLQAYCCSLVRGALAESLTGRLDYLDGTVFPHTCDSIQRLSDIWRLNTSHGFFADVVLPVKLTGENARKYLIDVLQRFKRDLESYFDLVITEESMRSSIRTFNTIRSYLSEIYELKSRNPGIISGQELFSIVRTSMVMDRDVLRDKLQTLLQELRESVPGREGRGRRLMLVGNACNHPDIYELIERSGGQVVWDDLCTGTRWFSGAIREEGDPIAAIADRLFERQVCPSKHKSPTARGELLASQARKHGVEGVIFLYLKFCDPHSFDYPYLKECFKDMGIPSMLLEIEDSLPPEGQILTRIETFTQMLGPKTGAVHAETSQTGREG